MSGTIGGKPIRNLFDLEEAISQQFKEQYMMQQIITLQQSVYEANKAKGFWDDLVNRNRGEAVALINSELYESLEAHRKGRSFDPNGRILGDIGSVNVIESLNMSLPDAVWKEDFERIVKDTFQDELADAVIRILDYTGGFGIQLVAAKAEVEKLPVNFGEAILHLNQNVNMVYFAHKAGIVDEKSYNGWSTIIANIIEVAQREKVDIAMHTEWKLKYNTLRAYKHGKKY